MKPTVDLVLHFDGSCDVNPGGRMGYGWSLTTADGELVAEESGEVNGYPPAERTNNTAEFEALLAGLEWVSAFRWATIDTLTVRGDSQLVVKIVNGEWRAKKPHLRELATRCVRQVQEVEAGDIVIEWVRREENVTADRLSTTYRR
jgi:ribonuclease HI